MFILAHGTRNLRKLVSNMSYLAQCTTDQISNGATWTYL